MGEQEGAGYLKNNNWLEPDYIEWMNIHRSSEHTRDCVLRWLVEISAECTLKTTYRKRHQISEMIMKPIQFH